MSYYFITVFFFLVISSHAQLTHVHRVHQTSRVTAEIVFGSQRVQCLEVSLLSCMPAPHTLVASSSPAHNCACPYNAGSIGAVDLEWE